jgi:GTPase SAR1 family protein
VSFVAAPQKAHEGVVSAVLGSPVDLNSYTSDRYKEAHGIIIVYDVTNQASFNHVSSFLDEISRHETTTGLGKPSILLVGSNADRSPRVVTTEAAEVQRLHTLTSH